jgi:hypothetical protein
MPKAHLHAVTSLFKTYLSIGLTTAKLGANPPNKFKPFARQARPRNLAPHIAATINIILIISKHPKDKSHPISTQDYFLSFSSFEPETYSLPVGDFFK